MAEPFKMIILGDPMVGKSAYASRHILGGLRTYKDEQCRAFRSMLPFDTNRGKIVFEVFDFDRTIEDSEPNQNFYANAKCALILFDVARKGSYKNVKNWYSKMVRICGKIPCAIGGNKCDIVPRNVMPRHVRWNRTRNIPYFDIAVLCNYNYFQPFTYLARKITADDTVDMLAARLTPEDLEYDVPLDKRREYEEAVRKANANVGIEQSVTCNVCEAAVTVVIMRVKVFCAACEGFYKKNREKDLNCTKQGNCCVKGLNRRSCAACRLAKYRRVIAEPQREEQIPQQDLNMEQQFEQQRQEIRHEQLMLQQQLEQLQTGQAQMQYQLQQLQVGQAQMQQQLNNLFFPGQ